MAVNIVKEFCFNLLTAPIFTPVSEELGQVIVSLQLWPEERVVAIGQGCDYKQAKEDCSVRFLKNLENELQRYSREDAAVTAVAIVCGVLYQTGEIKTDTMNTETSVISFHVGSTKTYTCVISSADSLDMIQSVCLPFLKLCVEMIKMFHSITTKLTLNETFKKLEGLETENIYLKKEISDLRESLQNVEHESANKIAQLEGKLSEKHSQQENVKIAHNMELKRLTEALEVVKAELKNTEIQKLLLETELRVLQEEFKVMSAITSKTNVFSNDLRSEVLSDPFKDQEKDKPILITQQHQQQGTSDMKTMNSPKLCSNSTVWIMPPKKGSEERKFQKNKTSKTTGMDFLNNNIPVFTVKNKNTGLQPLDFGKLKFSPQN